MLIPIPANYLFPIIISSHEDWPIADVENKEHQRKEDFAENFKLITISAFADPVENGGYDELDDATENKQHTHEHPDVQEGDIGHSRDILTD